MGLGGGGEEVGIKNMKGNVRLYGGKSEPMEKGRGVGGGVI